MKLTFDRSEYLKNTDVFEDGKLDEADTELCEFNDHIEDIAYELAYTRYALAKAEAQLSNTMLGLEKMESLLMDTSSPVGDVCFIQTHRDRIYVFDGSTQSALYSAPTLANLIDKVSLMEVEDAQA
jgi:hypothetical protein